MLWSIEKSVNLVICYPRRHMDSSTPTDGTISTQTVDRVQECLACTYRDVKRLYSNSVMLS
jgi:hypothetical protein